MPGLDTVGWCWADETPYPGPFPHATWAQLLEEWLARRYVW